MWEVVWNFCAPSGYAKVPKSSCVHKPRSPLNPVLLSFYRGFITQSWLIKNISHWFNLQLSIPPWRWGRAKRSNPLFTWGSPARPHLLVQSKSHLINLTKGTFFTQHLGKPQDFRNSVWEIGTKIKYIFLCINYNITGSLFFSFRLSNILACGCS